MLALLFRVGADRFALDAAQVTEVVPLVELSPIPLAPAYLVGMFAYREGAVPVVDLCLLTRGFRSADRLSTRIMLIDNPAADGSRRLFGLAAEHVTETRYFGDHELRDPGIKLENAPYLGKVASFEDGMIQFIDLDELRTRVLGSCLASCNRSPA